MDIKAYIKKNKDNLINLIENSDINNIVELKISSLNKKILLEVRDKKYKMNKCNYIIFSKIYDKLNVGDKIGFIRECYDMTFYEWLQTNPSDEDTKIIFNQIKELNNIFSNKKIVSLNYLWIRKINYKFPLVIKSRRIKHKGFIIGILNLEKGKELTKKKINKIVRLKNLKKLYTKVELAHMFPNINYNNIYEKIVDYDLDNELIERRFICGNIARLIL
jgi:hypothetical protein